jgi:hypothetical protein
MTRSPSSTTSGGLSECDIARATIRRHYLEGTAVGVRWDWQSICTQKGDADLKKKLVAMMTGAILFIGLQAVEIWQIISLRKRVADAEWSLAVRTKDQEEDAITTDVGTIQFMKRGYSIQLENVKYTVDGLALKGFVGNPLNLSLTNLTLKFTATKPLYAYRDDYRSDEFGFLFGPQSIGEAQTAPIVSLAPRSREAFEVTIPNVKQIKEGVRIVVRFTGERYSYGF